MSYRNAPIYGVLKVDYTSVGTRFLTYDLGFSAEFVYVLRCLLASFLSAVYSYAHRGAKEV